MSESATDHIEANQSARPPADASVAEGPNDREKADQSLTDAASEIDVPHAGRQPEDVASTTGDGVQPLEAEMYNDEDALADTDIRNPEAHQATVADGEAKETPERTSKLVALDDEGDIAADYLEELLDIADLDGDIDTYTEGGRAHVSVVTDATILVGKDGEVLEALQDLCRLAVMTETGKRSRLMLDVAGHRDRRRRELTDLATDAVEEAKASGEPVPLTPMNPFERKIVHDVVAAAGLTSESDGEEPNRRVVVIPVQ